MKLTVDIEKKLDNFHLKSAFETDSERFALLGASGSGKSMTLKCIAGVERPDKGRIVLGEKILFDSEKRISLPPRVRRIGYLYQSYALFPNMTVRQNICCAAQSKPYAESLIERFELGGVAEKYPAELSGGQAQRTAMARMLAVRPEVLLFDEPFSALDNHTKSLMEHEILDMLDDFDGPAVLVSHDRNEVYRLASRIGVMENGSIVEIQDKKEFFDHPVTVAAARLTGCKNISRLIVRADGTAYAEDWGVSLVPGKGMSFEKVKAVGYRAHYFEPIGDAEEKPTAANGHAEDKDCIKVLDSLSNVVDCRIKRVIEDTFSVTVCFKQAGNECDTTDALMTWVIDKSDWEKYEKNVLGGSFRLRIDTERLMLFS